MLAVDNLTRHVQGKPLLAGVTFSVETGHTLALLGHSGAGKTTLLRTIAGLDLPQSGTVTWDSHDLSNVDAAKRNFSIMFQDNALFPHMTVAENIGFGLKMRRQSNSQIESRISHLLQLVALKGFDDRHIGTLSGGEQQRVALARAIAPEPDLLLLDEPFGSLDQPIRHELASVFTEVVRREQMTAILVTHDHEEALSLGNTIGILHEGRLVSVREPEDLWRDPQDEIAARFLGFNAIFDAELTSEARLRLPFGELDRPLSKEQFERTLIPGSAVFPQKLRLVIPPQAVTLVSSGQHAATVTARLFRGSHVALALETAVGMCRLDVNASLPAPQIGNLVSFAIDTNWISVITNAGAQQVGDQYSS